MEEVANIKEGFQLMDTSNKGKINIDELKIGLHKLGHQITDTDVQMLMEAVSADCYLEIFKPLVFIGLLVLRSGDLKLFWLHIDCF